MQLDFLSVTPFKEKPNCTKICQQDKSKDDGKIMLNCLKKLMKINEREAGKGTNFTKKLKANSWLAVSLS
jgi:hypothetical protein